MPGANLQLHSNGRLKHFLSIEGLNRAILEDILDTAESFTSVTERSVKKVPILRGKTVANLFFEASTRTRSTFELAAQRLSADILNLNISTSATVKGESLLIQASDYYGYSVGERVAVVKKWSAPSGNDFAESGLELKAEDAGIDTVNGWQIVPVSFYSN